MNSNAASLRAMHAPAEVAAHSARLAAAGQVAEDLAADLHYREVRAGHECSPPPAGVTPPSSGFSGHGAPGG